MLRSSTVQYYWCGGDWTNTVWSRAKTWRNLSPYVVVVRRYDRYELRKLGQGEGLAETSSSADRMKPWMDGVVGWLTKETNMTDVIFGYKSKEHYENKSISKEKH